MPQLSRMNKLTDDFQGLNEKLHKALAVVAKRPDLHGITKPICGPSGSCVLWFKDFASAGEEVSEKPAIVDALQASLLQGELGVLLYIATLSLVLAFSLISRPRARCETTNFLTNSHCRKVQVVWLLRPCCYMSFGSVRPACCHPDGGFKSQVLVSFLVGFVEAHFH
jgi:hypothetical protein